jgi:multimeric flavodoxin WrbA
MKHLLIVYHTQSGSNERLAYAAARAARGEQGVEVRLLRALEAGAADLRWADGIVLVTPENFGYLSGGMKDFLDRTYYAVLDEQLNLPYAMIVGTGNDGSGAVRQLHRILKGYPMREVAEPLIVRGEPATGDLDKAAETGLALAAGLALGIF